MKRFRLSISPPLAALLLAVVLFLAFRLAA